VGGVFYGDGRMGDMRRLFAIVACGLLLMMALAGCKALTVNAGPTAKAKTDSKSKAESRPKAKAKPAKPSHPAAAHPAAGGPGTLRVLVEPAAGVGAIYKLITGAKSSVELTMYELRDTTAEDDLAADAKRGVDVRVILDSHLEKSRNTATYDLARELLGYSPTVRREDGIPLLWQWFKDEVFKD
jgi:phosphatidylserine/phosphatidylglycerophosphate/cardiolipin synthase-like enzyme